MSIQNRADNQWIAYFGRQITQGQTVLFHQKTQHLARSGYLSTRTHATKSFANRNNPLSVNNKG